MTTDHLTLGIDLGGTKIALALVDDDGRIRERRRLATDAGAPPEATIDAIVARAHELLAASPAPVSALGVSAAGQVNAPRGVVRSSPNLPTWRDVPLGPRLSEALALPAAITNDGSAVALAEHAHGAGRGHDDVALVFVGTGVGGGVISGGRLIDGAHGYGGEIGHVTLVAGGRRCTCGSHGCLEAYAGGWAIAERARDAVRHDPAAGETLLRLAAEAGAGERLTAATVARADEVGDALARRLVVETGRLLGYGLVSVIHTFNPRRLLLGGTVIEGTPDLLPAAARVAREHVMDVFLEDLEIVPTELGTEAGVIGAARVARRRPDRGDAT